MLSAARSLGRSEKRSELQLEVALVADPAMASGGASPAMVWKPMELLAGMAGWGLTWALKNKAHFCEKQKSKNSGEVTQSEFHTCSGGSDKLRLR